LICRIFRVWTIFGSIFTDIPRCPLAQFADCKLHYSLRRCERLFTLFCNPGRVAIGADAKDSQENAEYAALAYIAQHVRFRTSYIGFALLKQLCEELRLKLYTMHSTKLKPQVRVSSGSATNEIQQPCTYKLCISTYVWFLCFYAGARRTASFCDRNYPLERRRLPDAVVCHTNPTRNRRKPDRDDHFTVLRRTRAKGLAGISLKVVGL
jgi:hypothetical protein